MLRILFVVDSLMAGGIESQLVELVTRLDCTYFEPSVLCLYGPRTRDLHYVPALRKARIPLVTLDLGWSAWDKLRAIHHIAAHVWAMRPQMLQAEGYHANLLTRLASPLLPSTTLIASMRGVQSVRQLRYERWSRWTYARMVVNAPHLKESLVTQARVPAHKVLVIPNGISLERFAHPYDYQLRQQIAPRVRRLFVSLGRISLEKNFHWVVEGLGRLKQQNCLPDDVRLFIVGARQERAAQQLLDEAIAREALEGVVIQLPATDYPEDYYHACDSCILYSPAEGLANVSIEALAAGRPVLISEAANAAGVIVHGVNGWVARTNDTAHLADVLYTVLMLSDDELSRMQAACLRSAQHFSVEKLIQRYTDVYTTLANG